jgi:hypothetical protein
MLGQQWKALCNAAVAEAAEKFGSTWALSTAECPANSTTCFADFSKKGEKPRRIIVSIGQQTDEAIKAEIVRQLAALDR